MNVGAQHLVEVVTDTTLSILPPLDRSAAQTGARLTDLIELGAHP